jgi:uncharacterized membrane protein
VETDRKVAERTQADTEFLAREIASVRLSLGDVSTTNDLEDHFERLTSIVEQLSARIAELEERLDPSLS